MSTTDCIPIQDAPSHRGGWAWLLLVPPALALLGGMITLWLILRHPDHELPVVPVTQVQTDSGTRQHVVNSVTPPLN